jgi:hypothetical protein
MNFMVLPSKNQDLYCALLNSTIALYRIENRVTRRAAAACKFCSAMLEIEQKRPHPTAEPFTARLAPRVRIVAGP